MPIAQPAILRPSTPRHRYHQVDLLRGLSILFVILLHVYIRFYFAGFVLHTAQPRWLFRLLLQNGGNGVTLFFAISGFLITLTSIQRFGSLAQLRPPIFYRIRFARIAPLLLLLLLVLCLFNLLHIPGFAVGPSRASLPGALFAALTFHINLYEARHGFLPANWSVLWSLSIEEVFYLLYPVACLLLLRSRRTAWLFPVLLLAFILMGPFARASWSHIPIWQAEGYLSGMDSIAIGCLTALLTVRSQPTPPSFRTLVLLRTLGAAILFFVCVHPELRWLAPFNRQLAFSGLTETLLSCGAALLLFSTVLLQRPGSALTAPLRWMGRHSYELYLTHQFIVVFGMNLYARWQHGPLALWLAALALLTLPLAWLTARFFSEPWNRRLRPQPTQL